EVVATAEAFDDRKFTGRVVHLEPLMGRKSIRTERTTEQQDTKVREVLIELDPTDVDLPIDLQMTVRFLASAASDTEAKPAHP
ncbi:MAG: secretion protein HlyD, partial [Planctomycetota bacterium]